MHKHIKKTDKQNNSTTYSSAPPPIPFLYSMRINNWLYKQARP